MVGEVTYFGPEARFRFPFVLLFRPPDRARWELLSPVGGTMALLWWEGERFTFLNPAEKVGYFGSVTHVFDSLFEFPPLIQASILIGWSFFRLTDQHLPATLVPQVEARGVEKRAGNRLEFPALGVRAELTETGELFLLHPAGLFRLQWKQWGPLKEEEFYLLRPRVPAGISLKPFSSRSFSPPPHRQR